MPTDIHQKLDSSLREIRLLSPASSLEVGTAWKLKTFALDASPPFTALSYLWGIAAETVDVKVDCQLVRVNSSLACALKHIACHWRQQFLSREVADFYLWTDAICINQSDVKEREEQVKLMGHVYSIAEIVMGSLGPLNEATEASIDTLRLVHSEVENLDDDGTIEANLNWMQKYSVLTEADAGLPDDQFDANKSWRLLRDFLYMQYWRRAWVLQELVLAKRLLFFAEAKALHPDALFTTLQWFKTMKQIAKDQDAIRPQWLIPSVWNFLTYDNLLGWKAVLRIEWARTQDRESRPYRLLLSCAGKDLRATDPRDLIYGTMGLTKMGFEPDYSPGSSLGDLYARFMTWWFDQVTALQAEDPNWTLNHLDLLGEAGIGQVDDDDENRELACSLPSWTPNFPLHAKIYTPQIMISTKTADARIFPDDAPLPQVENLSLFLPTIILDKIVKVDKVKTIKESHGLLGFVVSHLSRHPLYPNGDPALQSIFRTLMKDILISADPEDQHVMIQFFGFLRAMIHGPETGVIDLKPEEALESLGLSTASKSRFAESVRKAYLPSMSTETLTWTEKWLSPLLQPAWDGEWSSPYVLDLCLRTALEIRELNYTAIAETSKGYLSIVPIGTKVADQICLMNRSDSASVIREKSEHWEHVGRCYSFGLSEHRSEEFNNGMPRINYQDPNGAHRTWESAERRTRPKDAEIDGVGMVAILDKPTGKEIILQKQYRPPIGMVTIEVPAGLIDAGESAEQAAIRELREETGYVGVVTETTPIMYNDPGFCNTNLRMVHMAVDMSLPENKNPKPQLEDGEFIEVFTVKLADLWEECKRLEKEGCAIDARVGTFAEGILLARRLNL
ncbi:ADP-ribose diphosphatase [Conoideocrella luteorostrata]|uniref:ADP-ribose diphosphatase n=1 Tax=Conoideocrella luteorostrata TaxID=1105319 RepID=A0AAJ0FZQ6_9HYPO|nr:ADP-ribose diphosphatase [Conoideocrella luteorostrata]